MLTDKLSIYLILKLTPVFKTHLIEKRNRKIIVPDLNATVESITNRFSKNKAELLYSSVYITAELFIKNDNNFVFFIWGGNTIGSLALKNLSKANSIPSLFFDFGNYKDKIFVDPCGTNIDSFIYNNYEAVFNSYYNNITTDDINFSFRQRFYKILNVLFFFDVIHSWISGLPFRGEINPLKKIQYSLKSFCVKQTILPLMKDSFYFIAFSHSYEIKRLNLKIADVTRTIDKIVLEARSKKLQVFAKFHPDEFDDIFIKSIKRLERLNDFRVVDNDAYELLESAKKVYLFNTSLFIPSMMKGKDIYFLCKSFFDKFNKDSLQYYLDFYLLKLEIDKYGNFLNATVERIINRLNIIQTFKIG